MIVRNSEKKIRYEGYRKINMDNESFGYCFQCSKVLILFRYLQMTQKCNVFRSSVEIVHVN